MLNIYAVYDNVSKCYSEPFQIAIMEDDITTDAIAVRIFDSICVGENLLTSHPQDYTLYRIAKYDNKKPEYINELEAIITAKEVIERRNNEV